MIEHQKRKSSEPAWDIEPLPIEGPILDRRAAIGALLAGAGSLIAGCSREPAPSRNPEPRLAGLEDSINSKLIPFVAEREKHWGSDWRDLVKNDALSRNYPYRLALASSLIERPKQEGLPVIFRDRSSGLAEIEAHYLNRKEEHTWIYIPSLRAWIDDTQSSDVDSVSGDPYLRGALMQIYPELELLHSHPTPTLRDQAINGTRDEHYLITGATPTTGDFVSFVQQYAATQHACRLISSVVSHYGVCSMELTKEAIAHRGLAAGSSYFAKDIDGRKDPVGEIKRIAERQSKDFTFVQALEPRKVPGFQIRFSSFAELMQGKPDAR